MAVAAEILRQRLAAALEPHGAIAEFARKTGFSRRAVENWRDGLQFPTVDKLDTIAAALSTTPSALLDPGSPPVPARIEDIVKILSHAPPEVLNAVRALLAGYAKGVETDPPPISRASLPEHREELPQKRQKPGK